MKTHSKISVVINTYNSADVLSRALDSVSWADELIVMDMESSDTTTAIAKKYTKHVFSHPQVGYVEPARNAALAKASGDWILVLDADEVVPPLLATKLRNLAAGDATADAYYLARKNSIFGNWVFFAGWWPDYQLRFFKQGLVTWSDKIHSLPQVKGSVDYLAPQSDEALEHYNYTSVEEYLTRFNRYTTHEVSARSQLSATPAELIKSFKNELFRRLFFSQGITGGTRGVGLSLLQSMYEVVVHLKSWEQTHPAEKPGEEVAAISELASFSSDLKYWIADWHIHHSTGITRLIWQVRRKFRI
jgi:glycosyltransferase involved in cell wall biosynthesis